ncbi:LysR family transcriptional regulator [Dyella solisilvae]|uniref:LysR family transcriptional regulator n=1 Tax=Dyella solisilvae TaxID=1920168 RepID=A0A370K6V0_9GAMM|nr:LysR substrate-binding domain-containing protein [Dyella solisilvae]RDI98187.1 LysR family transcriptional regulator [Dyella solisilvae]
MSRPLPSLNALHAFEAAARLGSVSKAAAELHVTHGAVSRHIRSLEEELDLALFQRQGRGLALTAAGQRLRDASTAAFAQLRDTVESLRPEAGHAPFVLGCPVSLLARWMIPRLERLMAELPELSLHLRPQEAPLNDGLEGLDAAVLAGEAPWPPGWRIHPLAAERIGPVVSPGYAQSHGLASDRPALRGQTLLHTLSRPDAWARWASSAGIDPDDLEPGPGFPHLYHLIEATVAGRGIAIAPEPLVANDLASGRLVAPWGFHEVSAQWVLATSVRRSDPRLEPLVAWLKAEFAQ